MTEEGVAEHIAVPNLESNTIVKRLKIEINDNNIKLIVTILRTMVMMIMVMVMRNRIKKYSHHLGRQ